MFLHQGIWLPDGEKHFPEWMTKNGEIVDGRGTYQIKKFREAMKWCTQFRCAVDVGAHVGLWAMHLANKFGRVDAFEPVAAFRACFERNLTWPIEVTTNSDKERRFVEGYPRENVSLYPYALGAQAALVEMMIDPADTGGTHVGGTRGQTQMRLLDSFAFPDVDFIKIDCEGYELEVLKGATETLARSRPTIIVEQKPHKLAANYGTKGRPAVDFILGLGLQYKLRREIGGDFILSTG